MIRAGTLAPGVLIAGVAAGPLFILTTVLAHLYLQLPAPVLIPYLPPEIIMPSLTGTLIVGTVIGLPVNLAGSAIMATFGKRFEWARSTLSWTFAGALAGTVTACLLRLPASAAEAAFGLIATSTVCAWLCSRKVEWLEAD